MAGALGDAQAKECPGAMMPALPALASRPRPAFSSSIVSSWPARARKYAVATPTMPPPSTSVFMASRVEQVAAAQRIGRIEVELAEAREICGPGYLGQDGGPAVHLREAGDARRELESEEAFADVRGANAHEPSMVEEGQPGARARSAGRGVNLAGAPHERVARDAVSIRQLVDEHVLHARLAGSRDLDLELRIDRVTDGHASLRDLLRELPPHGHAEPVRLHDSEDVAHADGDIDRDLAHALDLDGLVGERDEGRGPPKRDVAYAVALGARDRLHRTRFRVDDDGRLATGPRHESRLHGHGRGSDRAFAAGDIVAARINEEETKKSTGGNRLGHDRDEEAAMAARLEAEPGAQVVVMLQEPSPLLGHRAARHAAQPTREEPHADASRVEIDGADDAIRSHAHLRVPGP